MTPKERSLYVGELIHAVMNSEVLFLQGIGIIYHAKKEGLFDTVTILPEDGPIENDKS